MKVDVGVEVMAKAYNVHYGKSRKIGWIALFIFGIGLLSYGIYIYFRSENMYFPAAFMLLGILSVGLSVFNQKMLLWFLNREYKKIGEDETDIDMSYDTDHLYIKTPKSKQKIKWNSFKKTKEQDGLILAYIHDNYFQVIPINQFQQSDQNNLRSFLLN